MATQEVASAALQPYCAVGNGDPVVTTGPFIDTGINDNNAGRIYLSRLQAWEVVKAYVKSSAKMFDDNQRADLWRLAGLPTWDEVETLGEQVAALTSQLAVERESKVVPLAEVVDFFAEREKRRPDEPAPATQPKVVA